MKIQIRKKIIGLLTVAIILLMAIQLTSCTYNDKNKEEYSKLHAAIATNNLQAVKEVLNSGSNLNLENIGWSENTIYNRKDHTALGFALSDSAGEDSIILELLKAGANANNGEKYTYLNSSFTIRHDTQVYKALIENGADVNAGKYPALTILIRNMEPDYLCLDDKIQLLLSNGAVIDKDAFKALMENEWCYLYGKKLLQYAGGHIDGLNENIEYAISGDNKKLQKNIGKKDVKDAELIMFAATSCNKETLTLMKEKGCNFNITDERGMSPLHVAALCGNLEAVKTLIGWGLDVNAVSDLEFFDVVSCAAIGGNYEVLKTVLDNGGSFFEEEIEDYDDDAEEGEDLKSEREDTWYTVIHHGNENSIPSMIKAGFKPSRLNWYELITVGNEKVYESYKVNKYPYVDKYQGQGKVCDIAGSQRLEDLIDEGYPVTINSFAIYSAIEDRAYTLIEKLLDIAENQKIKINLEENLMTSIAIGDFDLVKLFIERGADMNKLMKDAYIYDDSGKTLTAVHAAATSRSEDIMQYLIDNGADLTKKDGSGDTPYERAEKQDSEKGSLELSSILHMSIGE